MTRGRTDKRGKSYGKFQSKSKDQRSKSRPKSSAKSKECWVCGKEGHFKRDCPNKKDKSYETANVAQEKEQPMILTASVQATKDEWVLDSGCTFHITPKKTFYMILKSSKEAKFLWETTRSVKLRKMGSSR